MSFSIARWAVPVLAGAVIGGIAGYVAENEIRTLVSDTSVNWVFPVGGALAGAGAGAFIAQLMG